MFDAPLPVMQRARGRAAVALTRRTGATRLDRLHQSGSAKAFLPRVHWPEPEVVFLNTAGGLTGGDVMRFEGRLGPGASATLTTQTAERAYRSAGGAARLDVTLAAGEGAELHWLPQETILFEGSALDRRTEIDLAPGARLLMAETLVLGRAAMGERVTSLDLADRRTIRVAGRPLVLEPLRLDTGRLSAADPAGLGGATSLMTLVHVDDRAGDGLAAVRACLDAQPAIRAAASAWNGRLVVRALATDAHALRKLTAALLTLIRGRPLPRVWQV